jgi:hypothetical protein
MAGNSSEQWTFDGGEDCRVPASTQRVDEHARMGAFRARGCPCQCVGVGIRWHVAWFFRILRQLVEENHALFECELAERCGMCSLNRLGRSGTKEISILLDDALVFCRARRIASAVADEAGFDGVHCVSLEPMNCVQAETQRDGEILNGVRTGMELSLCRPT